MNNSIKITAPAGMTGLAVQPWRKGEVYAVAAANWSEPSSPVMQYHGDGVWGHTQYQAGSFVACYGRADQQALAAILIQAIHDDVDGDGGDVDAVMADAVAIG